MAKIINSFGFRVGIIYKSTGIILFTGNQGRPTLSTWFLSPKFALIIQSGTN